MWVNVCFGVAGWPSPNINLDLPLPVTGRDKPQVKICLCGKGGGSDEGKMIQTKPNQMKPSYLTVCVRLSGSVGFIWFGKVLKPTTWPR